MWDGRSAASWTMNSPRSVSTTRTPAAASASLSAISSVTIDFDLTARAAPWLRAISTTIRVASAAVGAQCTRAPRRSAASANRAR